MIKKIYLLLILFLIVLLPTSILKIANSPKEDNKTSFSINILGERPFGNLFIKKLNLKNENFEDAYKILSNTSVLQSICGRICPHFKQCMGKCTRGIKQEPVNIGDIEAFVGDLAIKKNYTMEELDKNCVGKKVAIIGSGPSRAYMCCIFSKKRGKCNNF